MRWGRVDDDDSQSPAVEPGPGAALHRPTQRVCVVRDQDDRGMGVQGAEIVHQVQLGHRAARTENRVGGLEQGASLRIAVPGAPDGLAVYAQRDQVQERQPVHVSEVDSALDSVAEGTQRGGRIAGIQTEVSSEVVARSRGYADERQFVRASGGSDDREGAVTAGHPERVRAACHCLIDQAPQVQAPAELDDLDALLPSAFSYARTRGGAPT